MPKYFISYILSGEAKEYCEKIAKDLSARFGLKLRLSTCPLHATLMAPFERESVDDLTGILESFSQNHSPASMTLSGFGHFGRNVIFADLIPSQEAVQIMDGLAKDLGSLENPICEREDLPRQPHITLAKKDISGQFEEIWDYLETLPKQRITLSLDAISLVTWCDNRWEVIHSFPLNN